MGRWPCHQCRKKAELEEWINDVEHYINTLDDEDKTLTTKMRRIGVVWQELSPFILHSDFQLFRFARFCVARLALDEVLTSLPDLHVLKGVFRATGLQRGIPTFAQFCRQSVLYLRCSPLKRIAKLYYVGSAEGCTSIREASRYRKYKQVQQDKLVSAELCLCY